MKKRLIALLAVFALCMLPVMAVYAEETDSLLVAEQEQEPEQVKSFVDYSISEEEDAALNALAQSVFDNHGIEFYFTYDNEGGYASARELATAYGGQAAGFRDYAVLALTRNEETDEGEWYIYMNGRAANIFSDDDRQAMWDAFAACEKDYDAISAYYAEAERQLTEKGVYIIPDTRLEARLVDNADLLSPDDEEALLEHIEEISERQQFDVVVVTVDSLEGKSPMEFADDFYDYNGYGYGDSRDGALLLVSMEDRDYWISTCGYGIYALTDAGIEYISEQFLPYLSDGEYTRAFACYADMCDEFVTQAKTGEPYDTESLKGPLSPAWVPVAIGGGALGGRIPLSKMKRKLRSVRKQTAASNYMRRNSLSLRENSDNFLYSNVKRVYVAPVRTSSGGGGSSTHFSSSGTSHGGGGGKF